MLAVSENQASIVSYHKSQISSSISLVTVVGRQEALESEDPDPDQLDMLSVRNKIIVFMEFHVILD
jgi:hypothetical protein